MSRISVAWPNLPRVLFVPSFNVDQFSDARPADPTQVKAVLFNRVRNASGQLRSEPEKPQAWKGDLQGKFVEEIQKYIRESSEQFEDGYYQVWTQTSDGVYKREGEEFTNPRDLDEEELEDFSPAETETKRKREPDESTTPDEKDSSEETQFPPEAGS